MYNYRARKASGNVTLEQAGTTGYQKPITDSEGNQGYVSVQVAQCAIATTRWKEDTGETYTVRETVNRETVVAQIANLQNQLADCQALLADIDAVEATVSGIGEIDKL